MEDQVAAYDPATGKANVQTIQHTYINHDNNLLAVTLQTVSPALNAQASAGSAVKRRDAAVVAHGAHAPPAVASAPSTHDETIQTTTNHPWLTADHGWILASFLRVGEPVQRVDGSTAVVVAVRAEPGAASMWDLTISNVHTFAVGNGAYVVHNCKNGLTPDDPFEAHLSRSDYPETASHIEDAVADGQPEVTQWDPSVKDANRRESLRGWKSRGGEGLDRDEWPMASTRQGGTGADIRYVSSADNRGAGSTIAGQLRGLPNEGVGRWFRVVIDD